MKKAALVFMPAPGMGHLVSAVEAAKLLTQQNKNLSITVLTLKMPFDKIIDGYIRSLLELHDPAVRIIELQQKEYSPQVTSPMFLYEFIDSHKSHVRDVLVEISNSGSTNLSGIVIDMLCTTMIDVANEFGAPSYVFFASGAAMLGLCFHMQSLRDNFNEDVTEFKNSNEEMHVPTYINPVPASVVPSVFFDKNGGCHMFLNQIKRYRETKGILVNTSFELESHAVQALHNDETIPPVYPIGPLLNPNKNCGQNQETDKMIMEWLDLQPDSSVVFICFGTIGCFDGDQVKEIADALEHSGYRFLWSIRRPPPKEKIELPSDYENLEEVLPEGFIKRTAEVGKVLGWAPQAAVLSHPAIGGFVSHCGWNSILESVWFGVPVATWPLYSEQQVNAFQMLKDLDIAVEVKMEFRKDFKAESSEILSADFIESRIRHLMDSENEVRRKAKEMKEKSRSARSEGGSSTASLKYFIDEVFKNIP